MADTDQSALLAMTTGIIANFVANNRVSPDELPGLVAMVHGSLSRLGGDPEPEEAEAPARLTPAAIRKLIQPDGIVSLIDGRKFKSMKRHLSLQGYTPKSYRAHFSLPKDFPMVSPEYAAQRSALAKSMGLGQGGRQPKKAEIAAKPARKAKTPKS
ncbi:MucR family transcriptional regulator [Brevundimonas sp. DC300-4]|uniref:MucR family transcriptional regulator n=1 Tax=Brevundimonas sp. DC300-4 TaxID=2804594 RepID=UPI003CF5204A